MSNKDPRDEQADSPADDTAEVEPSMDDHADRLSENPPENSPEELPAEAVESTESPVNAPAPAAPVGSGGRGLSLLALVLSLIAVVGVAWQILTGGASESVDSVSARVEANQSELAGLAEQLAALDSGQSRIATDGQTADAAQVERLSRIEQQVSQLARDRLEAPEPGLDEAEVDALVASRMVALEERIEALARTQADLASNLITDDERAPPPLSSVQQTLDPNLMLKLDLLEAAALLSIGQARLELAGDQSAAVNAYRQAHQMLAGRTDSRLNGVKQRLAEELLQIESIVEPDWTAAAAQLARWEQQVPSWPLRPSESTEGVGVEADSATESGWFTGVRQSLGQLVTVERRDDLPMDTEVVTALHEQLRLQLASAGLALERRDLTTLRLRLSQVGQLIDEYFDGTVETLHQVQTELERLSNLDPVALPGELGQAAAALDQVIETL